MQHMQHMVGTLCVDSTDPFAKHMQHIRGFFRPTGVYDAERLHGLTMIHHTCTGTLKRFKRATIDENRFATFTTS